MHRKYNYRRLRNFLSYGMMDMQPSFLSAHCVITALVQDVKVKQCFSKHTHQNHSHHFPVGTISPEFSKWATMDPNMKKEYRGIDASVGFVSAWESQNKNVGKGEQEIRKITDGKRIDFEIRFMKPFAGVANAYMTTDSMSRSETIVNWGFDSKMNYPMNLMLLFNMEKTIGNDLSTGLANLKNQLENKESLEWKYNN